MSKIDDIADVQRPLNTTINKKSTADEYDAGDKDALSDGDEFGKGATASSVGGKTDITKRGESSSINPFTKDNEYPPAD